MSEQLALENEAFLDEFSDRQANENLQAYLNTAGVDDLGAISKHNKQVMADVPLELQLDRLQTPAEPATDRDKLVAFFEKAKWLPKSPEEIAATVPRSLRLTDFKVPGKARSQKTKTTNFAHARSWYEDSLEDIRTFGAVGVLTNRTNNSYNPVWLRNNRRAIYLIADNLAARESLDKNDWPDPGSPEYEERQHYWRGSMLFAAEHGSSRVLSEAMRYFFPKAEERARYAGRRASGANAAVGRPAVNGTRESVVDIDSEDDESPTGFSAPAGIERSQLAEYEAKTVRAEHHAEQNGGVLAAEMRELGGKRAIRNQTGEVVTTEPPDDQPSAEQLVRHELEAKERRRKRFAKRR